MIKAILKNLIRPNSQVFRYFFRVYDWRYWFPKFWLPTRWHFNILRSYADYKKNIRFVQVGSNDGISNDPLREYILRYRWDGILVEPVTSLYERLMANYQGFDHKLIFENSAIATTSGRLPFYHLKESLLHDLPEWYNQIGSFNKEVVLGHRYAIPHFDELLVENYVQSITFSELLKKHNVTALDLVHIDAEGYDLEVLQLIPFEKLSIEFLMFEHKHLSKKDYKKALRLLKIHGFVVGITDLDSVAVKKSVLSKLPVI